LDICHAGRRCFERSYTETSFFPLILLSMSKRTGRGWAKYEIQAPIPARRHYSLGRLSAGAWPGRLADRIMMVGSIPLVPLKFVTPRAPYPCRRHIKTTRSHGSHIMRCPPGRPLSPVEFADTCLVPVKACHKIPLRYEALSVSSLAKASAAAKLPTSNSSVVAGVFNVCFSHGASTGRLNAIGAV
jgi:hypothetical protein